MLPCLPCVNYIIVNDLIEVGLCRELNDMNLKDTLWVWQKVLNGHDSLTGMIYRKGAVDVEHNAQLLNQLDVASRICKGRVFTNGDFNLPNIDLPNCIVNEGENSFSQQFYDKLCDLYYCQHVLEPSRQRGADTCKRLDSVIYSSPLEC